MNQSIKKFLIAFYVLVILSAARNLILRFSSSPAPSGVDLNTVSTFSMIMYYMLYVYLAASVISLIVVWKYQLPKYTLVFPVYFILYWIYENLSVKWAIGATIEETASNLDLLARFDPIFYVITLALAGYSLYRILREK